MDMAKVIDVMCMSMMTSLLKVEFPNIKITTTPNGLKFDCQGNKQLEGKLIDRLKQILPGTVSVQGDRKEMILVTIRLLESANPLIAGGRG